MKTLIAYILILIVVSSCQSKKNMPEFLTNDAVQQERNVDKAIEEAQVLLDSLENTAILEVQ
ncbi:MAG: hypothetical protein M9958_02745 [Chitinophagales bacterium]|nr:hypothetical protein [Chitinophagales bacterium]